MRGGGVGGMRGEVHWGGGMCVRGGRGGGGGKMRGSITQLGLPSPHAQEEDQSPRTAPSTSVLYRPATAGFYALNDAGARVVPVTVGGGAAVGVDTCYFWKWQTVGPPGQGEFKSLSASELSGAWGKIKWAV